MSISAEQLEAARVVYSDAAVLRDGPYEFLFIPRLLIRVGAGDRLVDALLCPERHASGGYPTRLFLSEPIPYPGTANWRQDSIGGRTWHTWSWDRVPPSDCLLQVLAAHLRAFK